jgi:TonB family protein
LPCGALARTARIEGTVEVSLLVSTDGSVADAQIVPLTNGLLTPGVVEAIRDWQYPPFQIKRSSGQREQSGPIAIPLYALTELSTFETRRKGYKTSTIWINCRDCV